jgi:hypothetical protein
MASPPHCSPLRRILYVALAEARCTPCALEIKQKKRKKKLLGGVLVVPGTCGPITTSSTGLALLLLCSLAVSQDDRFVTRGVISLRDR